MSEIVLDKVSKRFGPVRAVDAMSFRAAAGKFVVLLGPSGCGKSTVLRLIAGLESPDGGTVDIPRGLTLGLPLSEEMRELFRHPNDRALD